MFSWVKALMAILSVKKDATALAANAKAGWKTTEFWLNAFVIVVTVLAGAIGMLPAALAAKLVTILAIVYFVIRMVVKMTPSAADDVIADKIEKILREKLKVDTKKYDEQTPASP